MMSVDRLLNNSVYIIAEAGVNHNGNPEMAFELVDAAISAGVDAVKFQTFKANKQVVESAPKANYQLSSTDPEESQFAMLKKLELSDKTHKRLSDYCKSKNIHYLSTAFDQDSLRYLVDEIGLKVLKIPSGEITNGPLLYEYSQTNCDLIMSTGMSTLNEVKEALGVIAYGLIGGSNPSMDEFHKAYSSDKGKNSLKEKVTLLHCTTDYPAPLDDINLKAMRTMGDEFGLDIGYSDHSEGILVPVIAVSMGAIIIEKHFTLDKSLPGPDHKASLDPSELKDMVDTIHQVEAVMGDGIKIPRNVELPNRDVVRKSLVAANVISKGEIFTEDNLTTKRPGIGKSPMEYWSMLGKSSQHSLLENELIK